MIITTTSMVDGYRIVRYFPPIVANLVAGTGFFNDIVAGFSDFFGGQSETYQSYLRDMYAAAMRDLEAKAETAGANCLIGASFDLDQVSGKGMQMFMLNAVATPVTIKTDAEIAEEAEAEELAQAESDRREAERRERFAGVTSIAGLLDDPEIARQARERKRMYGRNVCASFLKGKALELGLGDIDITEDDIPDSF
ncbi:MAG: YbjQ family protein [Cellulomonas sp.]|nr:YbjQ family protein [Cellulomonas sp.]